MHVEVQERASTLRHVLDEFEILPLGWEESEKAYKEQVGTLQSAGMSMSKSKIDA